MALAERYRNRMEDVGRWFALDSKEGLLYQTLWLVNYCAVVQIATDTTANSEF